jgi:glutamyl-Q tRNA(Asp) synthetase
MEDIDPPRERPGADKRIIQALEIYGFEWDGPVTYQSQFRQRHEELVQQLLDDGQAYPGTCRDGSQCAEVAIRVRTNDEPINYVDLLQGEQTNRLESESGDFVIQRRDGLIAYQLAVVADDYDQGITEVVRGIDLLDSTPRQIFLQHILGFASPAYLHIPVAENSAGQKLSKQTGAHEIELKEVRPVLVQALDALGQQPAMDLAESSLASIWKWASDNWRPEVMAGQKSIPAVKYAMAEAKNPLS